MKFHELQSKGTDELKAMLREARENLRELRFKVSAKQHKNVRDMRVAKKLVAHILTVLKQRENEEQVKEAAK